MKGLIAVGVVVVAWVAIQLSGITKEQHSGNHESMSPEFRGIEGHFFRNSEGLWIHYREWSPEDEATIKGTVFLVHGADDHSGWFEDLAAALTSAGYRVLAHDHQGWGKSEGNRGHATNFSSLITDFTQFVTASSPTNPVYCLGRSMGGLVVAAAALPTTSRSLLCSGGLVLVSPALQPPIHSSSPLKKILSFTSRWTPKLTLKVPLIGDFVERLLVANPDPIDEQHAMDPLCFTGVTVRLVDTLLDIQQQTLGRLNEITQPVLAIVGDKDDITPSKGVEEAVDLMVNAGSTQFFELSPQIQHNPLHQAKSQSTKIILGWLQSNEQHN